MSNGHGENDDGSACEVIAFAGLWIATSHLLERVDPDGILQTQTRLGSAMDHVQRSCERLRD